MTDAPPDSAARVFELSKIFHERARLGLMTLLVTRDEPVEFTEILRTLALTKGNLAVHMRRLEDAGYVAVEKGYRGRTPRTTYEITPLGRADFASYVTLLEDILAGTRAGADMAWLHFLALGQALRAEADLGADRRPPGSRSGPPPDATGPGRAHPPEGAPPEDVRTPPAQAETPG